jgi:uncharacterized protein (TIGR00730 family)
MRSNHEMRICVFAGSAPGTKPEYAAAARDLGIAMAERRIDVVYGGARVGLMGVLADAALACGGRVTGVIPDALAAKEIAHRELSDLHVVRSMHERKAMMSKLADGFIALPGGLGTLEELFEVLTWAKLGIHQKPCGLLNVAGYFDPMIAFLGHVADEGFLTRSHVSTIAISSTPGALLDLLLTDGVHVGV